MKKLLPLMFLLLTSASFAQNDPQNEIQAVIDQLFDGMRRGDSSMVRTAFHPQANLRTSFVHNRTGKPVVHSEPINGFVSAVGTPHKEIWDERTINHVYHFDDNLAQVWMEYSFYLNDHLEHCGVNSIQLVRLEEGWKITDIADTRRKERCQELPAQ